MDEILIRVIESVKGLTLTGVLALLILCLTGCFLAWLRVTHSVAWLQATPEQVAAKLLACGKVAKPPKDPPSPFIPLAALAAMAACMLYPAARLQTWRRVPSTAAVKGQMCSARDSWLQGLDFVPDARAEGLPVGGR